MKYKIWNKIKSKFIKYVNLYQSVIKTIITNKEEKNMKFKIGNKIKSKFNVCTYIVTDITEEGYKIIEKDSKFKYFVPFKDEHNYEQINENVDYTGRLTHSINIETYVYLPIYSETCKCINNDWISIDDIDKTNIKYRRFKLSSIKQFKSNNNKFRYDSFKSDFCLVEINGDFTYPIHGSVEKWNEQLQKWKESNYEFSNKINENII